MFMMWMETFSALLAFVRVLHWLPVNSPNKGQWHGALMFSLIWAWINGCVNNREAGDLRRHRAQYDVLVKHNSLFRTHVMFEMHRFPNMLTLSVYREKRLFCLYVCRAATNNPDSKVHGAKMGPIWDRKDPGGTDVGPTNLAIWEVSLWHLDKITIDDRPDAYQNHQL